MTHFDEYVRLAKEGFFEGIWPTAYFRIEIDNKGIFSGCGLDRKPTTLKDLLQARNMLLALLPLEDYPKGE